jgi:hypothetical protein
MRFLVPIELGAEMKREVIVLLEIEPWPNLIMNVEHRLGGD